MNESKLITRNEAAELIGTTRQTVQNWIDKGVLTAKPIGKNVYVSRNEIDALLGDMKNVEEARKKLEDERQDIERLRKQEDEQLHQLRIELKVLPPCLEAGVRIEFLSRILDMAGESGITHRERRVLSDILGGLSIESIANDLGLTRERIRQIAYKAVRKSAELINLSKVVNENQKLKTELNEVNLTVTALRERLEKYEKKEQRKSEHRNIVALLSTNVRELNVSVRLLNCFAYAGIYTLADAVKLRESDYTKMRNFGKKSLQELEELLESNGLQFGMNVDEIV